MESGERKTAVHSPVVQPLFEFQKSLQDTARPKVLAETTRRRLIEQTIKTLERKYARSDPAQRPEIERQIIALSTNMHGPLSLPQVIAEDFTEAALSVALAANRGSLLVTSDEGGLFDNLSGRHGDISEIDLFLKSHTGSPHTVNRVGRENVFLDRPLLSVAISPQPAVLMKLAKKDGFLERGLTARFLWAIPKSRVGSRRLDPAMANAPVSQNYRAGILQMADMGCRHDGDATRLRLSHNAHIVWKEFEREIEPRIGPNGDLRQIKPWASKLAGAAVRIAGVCHVGEYLDRAAATSISDDQMRQAINMARLLIPHSVAAHQLMGHGGKSTALEVVRHYDASGWPVRAQSQTDWWRPVRRLVGDSSRHFEPVASILTDHGYLIPVQACGSGKWGRQYRANMALCSKQ